MIQSIDSLPQLKFLPSLRIYALISVVVILTAAGNANAGIRFPEDAGIVYVTKGPYFAIPDDGKDDTLAIQQALADHISGNYIIYFPDGTYDISDVALKLPDDHPLKNIRAAIELKDRKKRNILQGESRSGTVLRLMDSVPSDFSFAMLNFGQTPAQRFRNALRDITVSIGVNHPKAIGVQFNASNQGGIFNVNICSEDENLAGAIGLDMAHTDEIGPLLVRDLTVNGFDIGIRTAYQTASQTFENITLRKQKQYGWQNSFSQQVFVRNLFSENSVTAVINKQLDGRDPGQGKFVLLGARLIGNEQTKALAAIRNQKAMYLRDIETTGYKTVVSRELAHYRGNATENIDQIDEYWANGAYDSRRGGPFELFPSPDRMLRLPIEEIPVVPWEKELKRWASPHHFANGQPGTGSGFPNDGADDSAALQSAIDSGATTVYLPNGTWEIHDTVIVRKNVTRIIGCEARLIGNQSSTGKMRIADGYSKIVVIERLESGNLIYEQASQRTLVLNNILGGHYRSDADQPGKLFLNDVVMGPMRFNKQHIWARQLDIEGNTVEDSKLDAKVINDGGTVWILGFKTEDEGTTIKTINGGKTELYGALHVGASGNEPRFVTINASFSAAGDYGGFKQFAMETRGDETHVAPHSNNADIYTAFSANALSDEWVIDSEQATGVKLQGDWKTDTGFLGGWHGAKALHDGNSNKGKMAATFTFDVPESGDYELAMRWPPQRSGLQHANNVPVTVQSADGRTYVTNLTVDQTKSGGQWSKIRALKLTQGTILVTIKNDGTRHHVFADAVRLRKKTTKK